MNEKLGAAAQVMAGLTEALTYDDILLVPRHSQVLPSKVDVASRLTRRIPLNVPILSAAMDTVTESRLAIAMAQHGGLGIIHKNLTPDEQASEVDRVKRSESGMIVNPITLSPKHQIFEALELMKRYRISGVPTGTVIRFSVVMMAEMGRSRLVAKRRSRLVRMPTSRPSLLPSSVMGTPLMRYRFISSSASKI